GAHAGAPALRAPRGARGGDLPPAGGHRLGGEGARTEPARGEGRPASLAPRRRDGAAAPRPPRRGAAPRGRRGARANRGERRRALVRRSEAVGLRAPHQVREPGPGAGPGGAGRPLSAPRGPRLVAQRVAAFPSLAVKSRKAAAIVSASAGARA